MVDNLAAIIGIGFLSPLLLTFLAGITPHAMLPVKGVKMAILLEALGVAKRLGLQRYCVATSDIK